jgi:RNA polymerase sigma-70 factor, ECF subfamily
LKTFHEIYVENYTKMFRVAQKMVGDTDNASDIVQDVFISLFDNLNKGNNILFPGTWLYRATMNKCTDCMRKQKRFQIIELLNDHKTDEELIEDKEITSTINNAIAKMKPQEKILVVLYSEGLSYKEIAEATGIKFSSIGKMLSRILEKLGNELKNQHYELY